MKTNATMRNDIFGFFDQLGLVWKYLVNGFVGGLVWAVYKKSKFWEGIRQVFVGGLVSGYATPFIVERTSVKDAGFISFVVGMIGMVLIEVLYKWAGNKLKLLFSNQE
jgi:hypothetical protein